MTRCLQPTVGRKLQMHPDLLALARGVAGGKHGTGMRAPAVGERAPSLKASWNICSLASCKFNAHNQDHLGVDPRIHHSQA